MIICKLLGHHYIEYKQEKKQLLWNSDKSNVFLKKYYRCIYCDKEKTEENQYNYQYVLKEIRRNNV